MIKDWIIKLGEKLHRGGCIIGVIDSDDVFSLFHGNGEHIKWMRVHEYGKHGWFADPFILSMTEKEFVILAEEFHYADKKGRLVELVIERPSLCVKEIYVILSLDTHLSFPIIYRENGKVYVYPENAESGTLTIWEYDSENHCLSNPQLLIQEPLADSQIFKIGDVYYLFAIKTLMGTQDDTKTLYVYSSPTLMGPYQEIQTIHNERREERGAGEIFQEGDKIIRPAQCCENKYGESMIFYELVLKNGQFEEVERSRMFPDATRKYGMLLHTYNRMGSICVVDGYDYIHPWGRKVFDNLLGLWKGNGVNYHSGI